MPWGITYDATILVYTVLEIVTIFVLNINVIEYFMLLVLDGTRKVQFFFHTWFLLCEGMRCHYLPIKVSCPIETTGS